MSQIKYCIIPGCDSTNRSSALFEIPRNDPDLMEKWKKQLPMLNGFSYTSSSLICQDHFRSDEIICQTDKKQLVRGAVPTIFDINQTLQVHLCRFCMTFLQNTENSWISEQVKISYKNLMQTEFDENNYLPKRSCSRCLEEIQRAEMVVRRLQSVQEKLLRMLETNNITIKEETHQYVGELDELFDDEDATELEQYSEEPEEEDNEEEEEEEDKEEEVKTVPQISFRLQKKYQCAYCPKSFSTKNYFLKHVKNEHLKDEENPIEIKKERILCPDCGTLVTQQGLYKHIQSSHKDPQKARKKRTVKPKQEKETDESEEGPSKKRKRTIKVWNLEKIYNTHQEALEELKREAIWSKWTSNDTEKGAVEYYRCNRVKFRGEQCQSSIKLHYHNDSFKVTKFVQDTPHNCDGITTKSTTSLPELAKQRIIELSQMELKPIQIVHEMSKEDLSVTVTQVRNFRSRMKNKFI